MKIELENRFDEIFQEKTCFVTLNLALKRLYENKSELLLVLDDRIYHYIITVVRQIYENTSNGEK